MIIKIRCVGNREICSSIGPGLIISSLVTVTDIIGL